MRKIFIIAVIFLSIQAPSCRAQSVSQSSFTRQDTLRGSITPERAWWDVTHYAITVQPDYLTKTIRGENRLSCLALAGGTRMQIDLQAPMRITEVVYQDQSLPHTRDGNVYYIDFGMPVPAGRQLEIIIRFEGQPREAVNPPWDGGWIWSTDTLGNPWMSVACQQLGASVWYPCKDHQSDEPDSASLTIIVPDTLVAVGNGRLTGERPAGKGKKAYTWAVSNPINNYNIVPYIGKYTHWSETVTGEKGPLDLSYWVLEQHEAAARKQFTQAPLMIQCFEHWFGPYPFYEDGYKLVEAPHLGMEHQSAVAYGNGFENGYKGRDLSGSGWGKKWDFILIHESAHEWFGNNITTADIADMWVHEGFTNYSEALFTECRFGKKAGNEYCIGTRKNIANDIPIIGHYGVNREGSGDMYYKAGNLVLMIRQLFDNDEQFRQLLRGLNRDFYHQTVTTARIEAYISKKLGRDLQRVFDQYLRTTRIPVLEHRYRNGQLQYRWGDCLPGFDMPLKVVVDGQEQWIYPSTRWQSLSATKPTLHIDPNFYVGSRKM